MMDNKTKNVTALELFTRLEYYLELARGGFTILASKDGSEVVALIGVEKLRNLETMAAIKT